MFFQVSVSDRLHSVCLYVFVCIFACLFVKVFAFFLCLSVFLTFCLSVCLSFFLSSFLPLPASKILYFPLSSLTKQTVKTYLFFYKNKFWLECGTQPIARWLWLQSGQMRLPDLCTEKDCCRSVSVKISSFCISLQSCGNQSTGETSRLNNVRAFPVHLRTTSQHVNLRSTQSAAKDTPPFYIAARCIYFDFDVCRVFRLIWR